MTDEEDSHREKLDAARNQVYTENITLLFAY